MNKFKNHTFRFVLGVFLGLMLVFGNQSGQAAPSNDENIKIAIYLGDVIGRGFACGASDADRRGALAGAIKFEFSTNRDDATRRILTSAIADAAITGYRDGLKNPTECPHYIDEFKNTVADFRKNSLMK